MLRSGAATCYRKVLAINYTNSTNGIAKIMTELPHFLTPRETLISKFLSLGKHCEDNLQLFFDSSTYFAAGLINNAYDYYCGRKRVSLHVFFFTSLNSPIASEEISRIGLALADQTTPTGRQGLNLLPVTDIFRVSPVYLR